MRHKHLPAHPPSSPTTTTCRPAPGQVDRVKHGVDLLGRDHLVLGHLLTTLAAFTEAAAGTHSLPALANATLELLRAPQVGTDGWSGWGWGAFAACTALATARRGSAAWPHAMGLQPVPGACAAQHAAGGAYGCAMEKARRPCRGRLQVGSIAFASARMRGPL
jgi:hypothetical protein